MLAGWADEPWLAMLDSGGPIGERSRYTILCRRPTQALISQKAPDWATLRRWLPARRTPCYLPFQAGIIGMASYGAGMHHEGVPTRHCDDTPTLVAGYYESALVFDRQEKRLWWSSETGAPPPALPTCTRQPAPAASAVFQPDRQAGDWQRDVSTVIAAIAAGEVFQANLTMRWQARRDPATSPVDLYRHFRKRAEAPFGALIHSPAFSLLSGSIERFIALNAQGRIETRPIKGTAPVGHTVAEDSAIAQALANNPKEYAENLMITDLMRNDIGRVSTLGSVAVDALCKVERFTHWHHLVSSVTGQLDTGHDAIDLLAATLPPGSVTGAPKHQAMRLIDRLEYSARGAYCGTVFRIGADGAMDSNVVIRSIAMTEKHLSIGAGGGITYLSTPAAEYAEMLLKAAPMLDLFSS